MFIDLILYGIDKFDDKRNNSILMTTIKSIKDYQRVNPHLLYLMWSKYVYCICVYFRIAIFACNVFKFFLNWDSSYIPVGYCCMIFTFDFSFCVNNGLEKNLLRRVKLFWDSVDRNWGHWMAFRIDNYFRIVSKHGKFTSSMRASLLDETSIKAMGEGDSYKYLEVLKKLKKFWNPT